MIDLDTRNELGEAHCHPAAPIDRIKTSKTADRPYPHGRSRLRPGPIIRAVR